MTDEKIRVRVTENDMEMEVLVFSKHEDRIEVVLGEGIHNVKVELTPTANGAGYAGSAMGREIVYERTRRQVAEDIAASHHDYRDSRRR